MKVHYANKTNATLAVIVLCLAKAHSVHITTDHPVPFVYIVQVHLKCKRHQGL